MIDWAADTFKALIAASALWIAAYLRKRAIPLFTAFQKLTAVVNRVDKLEIKVSIIDSRQLALIETDVNPVFITDTKSNLIYANMSWLAMTGFNDIDHAKGRGYMESIPDDFVPALERLVERHSKNESSFEGFILFKNIKTGERSNTMCRSEPMHDLNNVLLGNIGRLLIIKP